MNPTVKRESLKERFSIAANKQFKRLNEKTQVLVPQNGQEEVIQSRLTHSYEVASSAEMIATSIADDLEIKYSDVDYQYAVYNASLLHDIGHPAFGHDGADVLHEFFLNQGLKEGFSDNNNNLIIIEKNDIKVRDYTLASIIKYPEKLYDDQKEKYTKLLKECLSIDKEHFEKFNINLKNQKKTIACQIMDEADRNTYACSDLADFFCLGNRLEYDKFFVLADKMGLLEVLKDQIEEIYNAVKYSDKNKIKSFFCDKMVEFNTNFELTEEGVSFKSEELFHLREYMAELTLVYFIKPIREEEYNLTNMEMLREFLEYVTDNEFYPSNHYRNAISSADTEIEKLKLIRNMVSEVSDWYIFKINKTIS